MLVRFTKILEFQSVFVVTLHANFFIQMTVTWTSGYDIIEAVPFVEWGPKGEAQIRSPAATLTFDRTSMCGMIHFIYFMIESRCKVYFSDNPRPFDNPLSNQLIYTTKQSSVVNCIREFLCLTNCIAIF
jgi:hypothetical protein